MAEEALVVLATFPDAETARRIVRTLVEEKLAACGNIVPGLESIYRWEGKIESSAEVLVIFKTTLGKYLEFEQGLRALHPYEVPEILGLPVQEGSLPYLRWLQDAVNPD